MSRRADFFAGTWTPKTKNEMLELLAEQLSFYADNHRTKALALNGPKRDEAEDKASNNDTLANFCRVAMDLPS